MSLASALQSQFDSRVRERGDKYFHAGRVKINDQADSHVNAVVRGSTSYHVTLGYEPGTLSVDCTCPYYEGGNACKHIWATILTADRGGFIRQANEAKLHLQADQGIRHRINDAASTHAVAISTPPVPSGLLREPQQLASLPCEMRIIKSLVFRLFASPDASTRTIPISFTPPSSISPMSSPPLTQCENNAEETHLRLDYYTCTYPMGTPLLTECVHHAKENRLRIKYRMGFTESFENVSASIVTALASSNPSSEFLYEHIMRKYKSSLPPIAFDMRIDEKPTAPNRESLKAIREYVPYEFRAYTEELLTLKNILVRIVPCRKTKCGDHRRLNSGAHLITVNEIENPLSFVFTLLHELAHAFAPRTRSSTPHDCCWKLMFGNMLVDCITLFPKDLIPYITSLACNPPSSKDMCEDYMVRKCGTEEFQERFFGSVDMLRAMLKLERRCGVKRTTW